MNVFQYEPLDLDGPAFRLLRLVKGSETNIECEIFQAWLYDDGAIIPYEALSYAWGGTEMTERVEINGKELGVTANLYCALQHLRYQDADRILWIDAICINQGDARERGHQVRQMGEIYSRADRVVIWLGLATYAADAVMESLMQLQKECLNHAWKDWSPADNRWRDLWSKLTPTLRREYTDLERLQRTGLESLLGQPWFERIWIVQEVANAKIAVVCSGTKFVSARIFALAPSFITVQPKPHCQAVLDIMPGSPEYSWWRQKRDLYTILERFKGSKATDQRDMIYALIGISSDYCHDENFKADYTKNVRELIKDTTEILFSLSSTRYSTMSDFLGNFTTLNTECFSKMISSESVMTVADYLDERYDEIEITESVVVAAAENCTNGREMMSLFLLHRGNEVRITENVMLAAALRNGKEMMAFLFQQQWDKAMITENVMVAAAGNLTHGKEVIEFLLKHRGDEAKITEKVMEAAAGNFTYGKEVMEFLLEHRRGEAKITEKVMSAAAANQGSGVDVTTLLLERQEDEVEATEKVFKAASGNMTYKKQIRQLLRQHGQKKVKLL